MTLVVGFTCSCRKFLIITCSQDTIGVISYSLVVTLPLEADLEEPLRDYSGAVSMLPCMHACQMKILLLMLPGN